MRPSALFAVAAFAFGIAVVHAQDSTLATPSNQTFRAATRLIQVSVVVHDGRRKPIEGLRAEDFQLFEDGKELPVSLFAVQRQAIAESAAAASGVFSNRVQSPSGGGVVAIVLDRLNTRFGDQQQARSHLLAYLKQVRPDDRIALYILDSGGMRILHDFTRDAGSLLRVLQRAEGRESVELAGSEEAPLEHIGFGDAVDAALDAFARSGFENLNSFFQHGRALTTIEALEAVSSHLAGAPGRKNLIWISSGFPFTFRAFQPPGSNHRTIMSPETRRAARALNDADIAVYAVDARGLVGVFSSAPSARTQTFQTLATTLDPIEGLRQFAELTGGAAYFNTNDIRAAISRAVDDSRLTYVLGYYPSNHNWDGKYRAIKVKVRRRGADVRHRAGYFASPQAVATGDTGRENAIMTALDSPLEATAVPMSVTVQRMAGDHLVLAIQLDPSVPNLVRQNGAWTGAIDVAVAQTLIGGKHAKDADITLPFALTDQMRDRLLAEGLRLTRTIILRPDAHQVRIVARDASSGIVGSVIITVSQTGR